MLQPDSLRVDFYKRIRRTFLADLKRFVDLMLVPQLPRLAERGQAKNEAVKTDARGDEDLGEILDSIADRFFTKWSRKKIADLVQPFLQRTATFNAGQINKILHNLVGVDVVGSEPWLADTIAEYTRNNVALIRTVPATFFAEIEKLITHQISAGDRWEDMADTLTDRYGVSESNAQRIARDQIGKLNGQLNETRQTELGIEFFIWRTMRDNRVRDEHEALDGERFAWDDPPAEGTPGEPVQCRCYAEPDLSPIMAEVNGEV